MNRKLGVIEQFIRYSAYCVGVFTLIVMVMALVPQQHSGEAYIGSFEYTDFNSGWTLEYENTRSVIDLPEIIKAKKDDKIVIENTLPEDVSDGMTIMTRAAMEDIYIYVGDELRSSYASINDESVNYYIPSAYVASDITKEDAGKTIRIEYTVKNAGIINGVMLSHGNNAWFKIIRDNLLIVVISALCLILGAGVILFYFIMSEKLNIGKAFLFMGFFIMSVGCWMISESKMRQLVFIRPTMSEYFSYLSLEIMAVFVCLYFDEVQHRNYHKCYLAIESVMILQIAVNVILQAFNVFEFYETLVFAHIWLGLGIIFIIITLIIDYKKKRLKEYPAIVAGIGIFLFLAIMELVQFYIADFVGLGVFLCPGTVILLICTIIQTVMDATKHNKEVALQREENLFNIIETITAAIDAKDEYTGGHSDRVGEYAEILAREMAADYNFSEEDIITIHYVGLMHDIGKIGVADNILNKNGRLTDEEFMLMKKHSEIGYDLLKAMDNTIDGLLDGVRHHHERFDGKGYPDGLEGTDIPLIARILCLADCYDAMTSNRVYRKRLSDEEVREEILRCAGTQFDPAIAKIFVNLLDSGKMAPITVEGMETNSEGEVFKSSVLEKIIQDTMNSEEEKITNPMHVRMVCYVIKLAEKNKRSFDIFYAESEDEEGMNKVLKECIGYRDICIEYSNSKNIVVLFDISSKESEDIKKKIQDHATDSKITITPIV